MRTMTEILNEASGGQESIFAIVLAELDRFSEQAGQALAARWGRDAKLTMKGMKAKQYPDYSFVVTRKLTQQDVTVRWGIDWEKRVIEGSVKYGSLGAGWVAAIWLEWQEATPQGFADQVADMLEARGAE